MQEFKSNDEVDLARELTYNGEVSLIFEVIEPFYDPHIIEYKTSPQLILLDVVYNKWQFEIADDSYLPGMALIYHDRIVNDESEIYHVEYGKMTEGVAIKQNRLPFLKIKTPYYSFWKSMHSEASRILSGKNSNVKNEFTEWLNEIYEFRRDDFNNSLSIIDLRRSFLIYKGYSQEWLPRHEF